MFSFLALFNLQVKTMGRIGLPLCHSQAMELKSRCEQAPYGRREETIVDTSVRNAWQLDASRLTIGCRIQKVVTSLIPRLANDLGCQGVTIEALPYKLVLYEEGGFFLPHRDTEKAPGMFATLVIQLPAEHKGGELVVQHHGKEKVFNFADDSASDVFFAAFFADCRHELRPVTSGLRLCLIYNLVHAGSGPTPSPADHSQTIAHIVQAVQSWIADPCGPEKLIYVLQHEYTQAGLSFRGLKNRDRAVAQVLRLVSREVALDVYLAIITKSESGSAEGNDYGYGYYKRRRWCGSEDPADWSMGEIYDTSVTLDNWVDSDDARKDIGEMSVDEDEELIGDSSLDDVDPEEEVEECSGNEGATMERWYRQATLVLWPRANTVAMKVKALVRKGFGVAVKKLEAELKACREQGLAADSQEWQECRETTRLLVKHLEKPSGLYGDSYSTAIMLSNVQSCGDLQLYISYLEVISKCSFSVSIADSLLRGCKHFGWPALHDSLCAMLQHNAKDSKKLSECVSLVAALAAEDGPAVIPDERQLHTCRELAAVVHAAVIAPSTEAVPVAALFRMLYVVDRPQLLQEAARLVRSRPEQYHVLDQPQPLQKTTWPYIAKPQPQVKTSLAAAILELGNWLGAKAQECGPFVELLEVCIAALTTKTSVGIAEPVSWAMKVPYTPCCRDCQDLASFLSDPSKQVGRFKMGKSRRMHLHRQLDGGGVDASHTTERVGNPQTLVVTKTRTHLQRQREQQVKDLKMLASLRALPAAVRINSTTNGASADRRVSAREVPKPAATIQSDSVVDLTTE